MSNAPLIESAPLLSVSERLRLATLRQRTPWRTAGSVASRSSIAPDKAVVAAPAVQAPVQRTTLPAAPAAMSRLPVAPMPPAKLNRAPIGAGQQPPMDLFAPERAVQVAKPKRPKKPKTVKSPEEIRQRLFKQLEISSLGQMLLCVPTSYVDCVNTVDSLFGLSDGFKGLFLLKRTGRIEAFDENKRAVLASPHDTLYEAPWFTHWRRVRVLKVELQDVRGRLLWVSFFDPWRWKNSDPNGVVLIDGTLQSFGPRQVLINTSEPPADVAGKVWARYSCPGSAKEEDIRCAILDALRSPESFQEAAHSLITSTLLSEQQLLALSVPVIGDAYEDLREFLLTLHCPSFTQEGELAAEVARMMAVAGVCNAAKATSTRYPHPKAPVNITDLQVSDAISSQSEVLTADQAVVVRQLVAALRSPQPLNGLLSGDVGTGKTLAFLIPAVAVHRAGGQVALISPTDILSNQLAANLQRRFPDVAVERVLSGGKIRNVQAMLVGTSGLASIAKKVGYCPNLLIVDEQHKLATKDRNSMLAPWTHHLEASATPIPRSLAATLFNGTQVFNLNTAPVKRQIESFVLDETDRSQVGAWMRQALDSQQRVAVIYPRVEQSPEDPESLVTGTSPSQGDDLNFAMPIEPPRARPVSSVTDAARSLEQRFPGRVGMLHGKLSAAEIAKTLDDFRNGVRPLVVASTIMETGVDIPDIRLLVVKDADNFGAAQLHQLRGRLARNGGAARFVMMVSDSAALAPETHERLLMVRGITDGYALAEADMKTRGFGDLAGLAQSGHVTCAFRLLRLELDDFKMRHDELAADALTAAAR